MLGWDTPITEDTVSTMKTSPFTSYSSGIPMLPLNYCKEHWKFVYTGHSEKKSSAASLLYSEEWKSLEIKWQTCKGKGSSMAKL